ncbi:unnamed protein product, partial [marine sediment metagenome]
AKKEKQKMKRMKLKTDKKRLFLFRRTRGPGELGKG